MYAKDSIDYQINLIALREIEDMIPMTRRERKCLRSWAFKGHDVDTNPWEYCDTAGYPLGYLQAFRIEFGRSEGIWDYWSSCAFDDPYWDEELGCIVAADRYI